MVAGDGLLHIPSGDFPHGAVRVGVRPENLSIDNQVSGSGQTPATVVSVEPLGGFTVVTLSMPGNQDAVLRATLRGQPSIKLDTDVVLGCQPANLIFFDGSDRAIAA